MGALRRDSLVWRLLAVVGGAFAVTAVIVFLLVNTLATRVVLDSARDVYAERLEGIMRTLDRQAARLELTGQPAVYLADFQESTLRNLAEIYYADPEAEIFPFITDSTGILVLHPRHPITDAASRRTRTVATDRPVREGDFEYEDRDGRAHWAVVSTFEPWGWVVGYRVPQDVLMADVQLIRQRLVAAWTVATVLMLLILLLLLRRETQPLLDLADAASAMADGDLQRTVATRHPGEVGVLAESFVHMRGAIRRQLAELRESESRYRQIFDAMADGLVLLDQEGRIVAANPHAGTMYGLTQEHLVGRSIEDLLRPEDRELAQALRTPPADMPLELTGVTCDREGRELDTEIGAVRLVFQGQPHAMVILRDVTDQRRLEHQLLQSQKLESVGRLAGGIAHDFNNLLTPVLGYSEMVLGNEDLSEETRSDVQAIRRAGERARKLARQLLAFSRRQVLEMQDLDLAKTLVDFEPILRRTLREDIELAIAGSTEGCLVHADVSQIEQVIMNLIINAMDAMPDGGRIDLLTSRHELTDADVAAGSHVTPGCYVRLLVRDTGHGIPPEIIDRVFEPFFTTKEAGKGTGLGLATILGIAQQHGGSVDIRNRAGGGCDVELLLPCVERESIPAPLDPERPRDLIQGQGETVVLVEDDDMVRDLVQRLLLKNGYEVRVFESGQDCRDALLTDPEPADILLTDVVMPGLNGPDLRDQLHADGLKLPALFMSGYAGDTLIRRGLAAAHADFLQKPVSPETLLRKLRDMIEA